MAIRVTVRVKPGASRNKVRGSFGDPPALVVAVSEPAIDGRASTAVCRAIAEAVGVSLSKVSIVMGQTSRTKVVEINDNDPQIERKIAELLKSEE
ncbi:MAG: DUF167 domain-containing protein [Actinobacteria bacterium]|jgi:uncharacterized protein (TIGR00251 family)|nr:DUF167 domain-containing protein [Actinomycetota bacterium]